MTGAEALAEVLAQEPVVVVSVGEARGSWKKDMRLLITRDGLPRLTRREFDPPYGRSARVCGGAASSARRLTKPAPPPEIRSVFAGKPPDARLAHIREGTRSSQRPPVAKPGPECAQPIDSFSGSGSSSCARPFGPRGSRASRIFTRSARGPSVDRERERKCRRNPVRSPSGQWSRRRVPRSARSAFAASRRFTAARKSLTQVRGVERLRAAWSAVA